MKMIFFVDILRASLFFKRNVENFFGKNDSYFESKAPSFRQIKIDIEGLLVFVSTFGKDLVFF